MKIIRITDSGLFYTSNVYLVLGEWSTIDDVNTLVDVGADPSIIQSIEEIYTGVGKKKIDQVILTHTHSDHSANLSLVRSWYNPVVCAFSPYYDGVDRILHGGEMIRLGERWFEVIHLPGHSDDSILLYNQDEGVLFAGDSSLIINSPGGTYSADYINALKALVRRNIKAIYFGHGDPLLSGVRQKLRHSLENAMQGGQTNEELKKNNKKGATHAAIIEPVT